MQNINWIGHRTIACMLLIAALTIAQIGGIIGASCFRAA